MLRWSALLLLLSISAFFPLSVQSVVAQTLIYVRADASGTSDGSSWTDAYTTLQAALDDAEAAQGSIEIWVAKGTYRPTFQTDSTDARTATFQLLDGVEIYGGFEGAETSRSGRNSDPSTNETVLSGDIGSAGFAGDNAYHVLTGSGVGQSTVLDGFTITGGRANGSEGDTRNGGGMYNDQGSPTLANCRFVGNRAQGDGGGIYNWYQSNPSITNCTFEENAAGSGGGAINNGFESNPYLENVVFDENTAGLAGGAVSNFDSSPTFVGAEFRGNVSDFVGGALDNSFNSSSVLINVHFAGNEAENWGGAMANDDSDPSIMNAVFSGNKGSDGGALHNETSSPTITNATFSGNLADDGFGGGEGGAIANLNESFPQIRNSILWKNEALGSGAQFFLDESSQPLVGRSIVEGGLPEGIFDDGHNLDQNPQFETTVDPNAAPSLEGDLRVLTDGAPGLDAADKSHLPADSLDLDDDGNTTELLPVDLDGTSRLVDNNSDGTAALDIGAYEAPASVLPVELAFFNGHVTEGAVLLTWQTTSETDNAGFGVQRHFDETGWATIGFVEGTGTSSESQGYRYTDREIPQGVASLTYRLEQVDVDGTIEHSEAIEVELAPPSQLLLEPPYPNPSTGRTTVRFAVPRRTTVTLSIYDVMGRRVAQLPQGEMHPGQYVRTIDVSSFSNGLYLLHLKTDHGTVSKKMNVVR